jgi:hypothetical protein
MNEQEKENWAKVKKALEEAGKTDCFFYKRAVAIANKQPDPINQQRAAALDELAAQAQELGMGY